MKMARLSLAAIMAICINTAYGANGGKSLEQGIREFAGGYSSCNLDCDKTSNCTVITNTVIEKKAIEAVSISTQKENINPMGYQYFTNGSSQKTNAGTQILRESWSTEGSVAAIYWPGGIILAVVEKANNSV